MAVNPVTNLTLADWAKRIEPDDGGVASVAELLSQTNEFLDDCVFKMGNLPTGHRHSVRTGLPDIYWRSVNEGTPDSKSQTAQVDEGMGIVEARSKIDKILADLNGNTGAFRLSEDQAFIEAMGQEIAEKVIYGNPALDPKQILGLAARYGSLSAGNARNILSAGGATNLASIYLIDWSDNGVFCFFPKGSKAGMRQVDKGLQDVQVLDGGVLKTLEMYVSLFQQQIGLAVKDWRRCVRICNIDTVALLALTGTQALTAATSILKLMLRAFYRLPKGFRGRTQFVMNRTVHSGLALAALDKSQNVLAVQQGMSQFGTPMSWLTFLGVPIRCCDALLDTEGQVT